MWYHVPPLDAVCPKVGVSGLRRVNAGHLNSQGDFGSLKPQNEATKKVDWATKRQKPLVIYFIPYITIRLSPCTGSEYLTSLVLQVLCSFLIYAMAKKEEPHTQNSLWTLQEQVVETINCQNELRS